MTLYIQNCWLPNTQQTVDIHIKKGVIQAISPNLPIPPEAQLLKANGMAIIPGFVN